MRYFTTKFPGDDGKLPTIAFPDGHPCLKVGYVRYTINRVPKENPFIETFFPAQKVRLYDLKYRKRPHTIDIVRRTH